MREAGLLPLLMAIVHITGDLSMLDAAGHTERPQFSTDLSGSIPPSAPRHCAVAPP